MKEELIKKAYDVAVERYAAVGLMLIKLLRIYRKFHCLYIAGRQMMWLASNQTDH